MGHAPGRRGGWGSSTRARSRSTAGRVVPTAPRHEQEQGSSVAVEQLGRALLAAAAAQTDRSGPPAAPGPRVMRRTPTEVARVRAGVERAMRIEAGRRARRLPYLATAATATAGYGAWGAAELARAAAGAAGQTGAIAGTVGLCAAGVGALRITYRHGITAHWQRRWWTAGAAATGWVSTAAAIGPASWPMSAALAVGATAVSAGWLRAHEVPDPGALAPAPVPIEAFEPGEDLGEVLAQRWADAIGRKGGVVAGARLTGRTDLPNAIQWLVETTPGSSCFDQLLAARPRIAAGLRQSQARVILEPVADDESTAMLSIVTRDVLAEGVPYPGPRYRTTDLADGRIPIGPYADGTGEADYVAVDAVGCRNGLATGAPGSGKSAFLEAVALGLKASGRWHVLFGDGDPGGGSSPLLNRLADWTAVGPEEVLAQLEAIEELLEVRSALKSTLTAGPDGTPTPITDPRTQVPLREMLPCPEFPGVCWVLDELHRLTNDDSLKAAKLAERLEKLTRIGRKYGIVLVAGTQSLLIADFGGGDAGSKLRGFLASRNNFAFYNSNRSEQHVVAGLKIAPSSLPSGGGYAFSTGTGRVSMLRVAWARDMSHHLAGLPTTQLDADGERVMLRHRPAEAGDPVTLFATASARLRAMRTGPGATCPDSPATSPDSPRQRPGNTGLGGGLEEVRIPAALTADNVIPMRSGQHRPGQPAESGHPDEPLGAPQPSPDPRPDTQSPAPDLEVDLTSLTDAQRCVYDALSSLGWRQIVRTGQLADLTGLRAPAVSKALTVLAERGLARKFAHGEWQSTATAAAADAGDGGNSQLEDEEDAG